MIRSLPALLKKRWFVLFLWQIASVSMCAENVFNTLLAKQNGETPLSAARHDVHPALHGPHLELRGLGCVMAALFVRFAPQWIRRLHGHLFVQRNVPFFRDDPLHNGLLVAPISFLFCETQDLNRSDFLTFSGVQRRRARLRCGRTGIVAVGRECPRACLSRRVRNRKCCPGSVAPYGDRYHFLCMLSTCLPPINVVLGGAIEWKTIA